MGCGSSTLVHPGNRRQANKPYAPPANQFSNGQATSHFVSHGGGNALVLKQGDAAQSGAVAAKQAEYIQVTLPQGVSSGQKIQVQAPDGRLNEIIIPQGFGPGSTFTVEFADTTTPTNTATNTSKLPLNNSYIPTAAEAIPVEPMQSSPNTNYDDGFASGFNNTPASNAGTNNYSNYQTATNVHAVNSQPNYEPYVK